MIYPVHDVILADGFTPAASTLLYGLLFVIVPVLGMALGALRALAYFRRAWAAEASAARADTLRAGRAIVRGKVLGEGDGAAVVDSEEEDGRREPTSFVRVEVTQEGTESESSGQWSHSWTEIDRRVTVRPFAIAHHTGARVEVIPPRDVHLVDAMDRVVVVSRHRRIRVAELMPGEDVFAIGVLEEGLEIDRSGAAYRGQMKASYTLRASDEGMFLSTEPLGARFRRRGAAHRRGAVAFAIVFGLLLAASWSYLSLRFRGRVIPAIVTHAFTTTHTSDGDDITEYHVTASWNGGEVTGDVVQASYSELPEATPVDVLTVGDGPSQLGAAPSLGHGVVVLALVFDAIAAGLYAFMRSRSRAWYEYDAVVNRGSGKLPDVAIRAKEADESS